MVLLNHFLTDLLSKKLEVDASLCIKTAECARAVLSDLVFHDAGLLPTSLDGKEQGRGDP